MKYFIIVALPSKKKSYQRGKIDLLIRAFSLDGVEISLSSIVLKEKSLSQKLSYF